MTSLVVENGSVVAGANSYIDLTDAQTYWANWGYTLTGAMTTTVQTNSLYWACYAMERLWGRRYVGYFPKKSPQPLKWPREGYVKHDHRTCVYISDPTGAGAILQPILLDGVVTAVNVFEGGAGYTAPVVNIVGGFAGSGFAATAAVTNGVITGITVTSGGVGYFTPPSFADKSGIQIQINQIPQALKDAQCELAWIAMNGDEYGNTGQVALFPNESDNRLIQAESDRFGGMDIRTQYFDLEVDVEQYDGFRKVELILEPLLNEMQLYV